MINFISNTKAIFVTNGIVHARKLIKRNCTTYILGGELKLATEAIVGAETVNSLRKYNFTKGFFGTNGINRKCGFSTPDSNEAMIKKIAMEHCNHRYILADQEKFGKVTSVAFARFEDAIIITNSVPKDTFGDCDNIMVAHSNIGI